MWVVNRKLSCSSGLRGRQWLPALKTKEMQSYVPGREREMIIDLLDPLTKTMRVITSDFTLMKG